MNWLTRLIYPQWNKLFPPPELICNDRWSDHCMHLLVVSDPEHNNLSRKTVERCCRCGTQWNYDPVCDR